ncbi:MAG TPA: hypothetical protein VFT71_06480 [Candidatus Nitrosocosmicus sp.]|nr:hypothetical protein [Candidatus Nitrosocosmicus sp.]
MKQILSVILCTIVSILTIPLVYGQPLDSATTNGDTTVNQSLASNPPESTIGKSENITITDVRFRIDSNQITGTVTNNSTSEQSSISVYAVLF